MKSHLSINILTVAVAISLTTSLFATVNAVADETDPPPIQTEEAPLPPTEEATEVPDGQEGEANGDALPDEPLTENSEDFLSIMEQLPDDTGIILETEQGIVPLATLQAADLVLVGDPIWCPEGAAPVAGSGGCSISYPSLSALVYNISDPGSNGTIWILEGVDTSASFISIDGNDFANWDNYELVLQGGWNGDNAGTITSSTTFSMPIEIINWLGNVTVNNINVSGTGSTGLTVVTDGDISFDSLQLTGNDTSGLYGETGGLITAQDIIANNNGTNGTYGYGAEFTAAELQISGVNEFSGNNDSGLIAEITGDITIANMTASNNGTGGYGTGAELFTTSGGVILTGNNLFDGNNNAGLYIEAANGVVSVENVTSSNNGIVGGGSGVEVVASELELAGVNELNDNNSSGLAADTTGDITIANLTANGNGAGGYGTGAELFSVSGGVTFTGTNVFDGNNNTGLYIEAVNGFVVAQNITSNNNGAGGAYGSGMEVTASGLNLSGSNEFNGNNESGLYADIAGDITIANITANNNGLGNVHGAGAELISTGMVAVTGQNVFSGNFSEGLSADSVTGISVENAEVTNNNDTGLYLTSLANVVVDCSVVTGNNGFGIDADAPGLILNGVDSALNVDDDVMYSEAVSYVSNSCFTYTTPYDPGDLPAPPAVFQPQPVNVLHVDSGEDANLDCGPYGSTIITLPNGDGALLPCGLGDTARLIEMNQGLMPGILPRGNFFLSSFNLIVLNGDQLLPPLGTEGSIWYWNIVEDANGDESWEAFIWDGENWVATNKNTLPFIRVFFVLPEDIQSTNLAILFWDGVNWVELTDGLNLGGGRFVRKGGHVHDKYFEAEVNFIGTFVLVQK